MKKKHGVLILTPFYDPNIGGVETHLKDLTTYLRKQRKVNVCVLTYQPLTTKAKGPYFEKDENIEIIRVPWVGFDLFHKLELYPILEFLYITPWLFMWAFILLALKGKSIQVIHAQGFNASFIARILTSLFTKKFFASTHAIYGMSDTSLMAKMVNWTLRKASHVFALSNASKKELLKIGIPDSKVSLFTYWVDQEVFKPIDRMEVRKTLGWEDKFVVLFVGRFIEIKGMDLLLSVAKSTDKEIYFAFIGDGPLSSDIKNASEKYNNVIFIGKIDNHSLPLYYNAADLLCIPSKYEEGFGRVILEALSCGTPVAASNRGGVPEAIDDSVGILVSPTVENFKSAIESLFLSPERLYDMRANCREYAITRFSEENAESIVRYYVD